MASGKLQLASKAVYAGALLLMVSALGASHHEAGEHARPSTDEPRRWEEVVEQLSDGDLVFRTGRDIVSRLVLSQGDSPRFSHVGIIIKRESSLVVVHALPQDGQSPGGVLVEPLSVFASSSNASDIGFYRVKGINTDSKNRIREYVLHQIGKAFDDDFLLSEDGKFYCTELALKALTAAGTTIAASVPQIQVMLLAEPVVPPDYLRRSLQLEIISTNPAFERKAPKAAHLSI